MRRINQKKNKARVFNTVSIRETLNMKYSSHSVTRGGKQRELTNINAVINNNN